MWRQRKTNMKKIILLFIGFCSFQVNAQTWTTLTSGTTGAIVSVAAVGQDTAYVVGISGMIRRTIDGGTTWTPQTSGTSNTLYSTAFINTQKGFAVGDGGTVLKTIDAGATWTSLTLTSGALRFVYFYDNSLGFILGASGVMLRTTDGGSTWTLPTPGTSQNINAIFFTSATTGYFTGSSGVIFKSTDAGVTWSPLSSGTSNALGIVHFTSPTNGCVVGDLGTILRTTDAGVTWSPIASGTSSDNLTGMDFLDANNGFIVGGNVGAGIGSRLETTDGGATWTYVLPGTAFLYRVQFYNTNLGYAVGASGTILKYSSTVGIEENNADDNVLIYPNPSESHITIVFENEQKNSVITMFDELGKEVKLIIFSGKECTIKKGDLKPGTYFVRIIDENKNTISKKIIVK